MPAVTLRHSTAQRSQNCRVVHATCTGTARTAPSLVRSTGGVQPAGFQPGAGSR